jgi:hypothetical protein
MTRPPGRSSRTGINTDFLIAKNALICANPCNPRLREALRRAGVANQAKRFSFQSAQKSPHFDELIFYDNNIAHQSVSSSQKITLARRLRSPTAHP